ncbi:MAG: membrane protein insertase YidC [Hyphomicrobiaceae bacterium]
MQPLNSQNDPGDQKNMLLAILLSVCVLLGWQYFYASPKVQKERERLANIEAQKKKAGSQTPAQPIAGGQAPSAPGTAAPGGAAPRLEGSAPIATSVSRDAALAKSTRARIATPSIRGTVNLKGGRIDDVLLVKYHETPDKSSPNIVVFSPANAPNPYFAEHGWVAGPDTKVKLPNRDTVWKTTGGKELTPTSPLKLTWDNGAGLTFKRTISVDEDYLFSISDEVENKSGNNLTLFPYARIFRGGTPTIEGFWVQHEGMIGFIGQKEDQKLEKLNYSDALEPGGNKAFKDAIGGWLGFTDKYWASALVPDQNTPYTANMISKGQTATSKEYFQTDYLLPAVTLKAGGSHKVDQRLFVGAKKVDLINRYETENGIFEFNYVIDWGWFYFITKPLYQMLNWLYGILGNFGLAILGVTVAVKIAFFWFANKSYESMAKMKKLQPEMTRLRDRYKDDKMQQQKELMELYKKEKINPMAGCLPVLIQIPVFFALYKVLFISIDMRHAPFFGWIQDLSAKDPTSLFNLFGLLPFAVPDFLTVGVWPLLMGITMWIQMQLNPQQPDPVQQQVFNWMPVMFTFLLASFPAGLVIYWAWNNILSLVQQWFIMKRQGVDIPLMDNLRRNFGAIGKFFGDLTSRSKS